MEPAVEGGRGPGGHAGSVGNHPVQVKWRGRACGSGCRKECFGATDVESQKAVAEEWYLSSFTGKSNSDQWMTGHQSQRSPVPLVAHTQQSLILLLTEPTGVLGSCRPPGMCLAENVYRLRILIEWKQFPQEQKSHCRFPL